MLKTQYDKERFREQHIRPVYTKPVDVSLQLAKSVLPISKRKDFLKQSIVTIESLYVSDLQDYYLSLHDCISEEAFLSKRKGSQESLELKRLSSGLKEHTAILYPILLPGRLELLLILPGNILQRTITEVNSEKVNSQTVNQTARAFQKSVNNKRSHSNPIRLGKKLYRWLIAPISNDLTRHNIQTLVTVPSDSLRMIPMTALMNPTDKSYLIEKFALATTPSLTNTNLNFSFTQKVNILVNGLSEAVQGFSTLPHVRDEVTSISTLFHQKAVLLNQDFVVQTFTNTLSQNPYTLVHIASHGQFNHNNQDTFLLAYDKKLNMNKLEELLAMDSFQKQPVELLTLSACQTAMGDERAALGLAGVAIKSGVKSAIASLWAVNDNSTAELMKEFYRQLLKLPKAQALQQAQLKVMKMEKHKYAHPYYWAPFLLIGNWL